MKTNKSISVLLPSRKRPDYLKKCIDNLISTAYNVDNFEILVRLDNDDAGSIDSLSSLPFDSVDISVIIGDRFEGYADLHIYINELCSLSRGTFLFLYNDDSKILTSGWDSLILKETEVVALNPASWVDGKRKFDLFPIIHRKIYDTLGFFSLSPHNDSWIFELTKTVGLEKKLPNFRIDHYRSDVQDITTSERIASLSVSGQKHIDRLREDMDKTKDMISKAMKGW